MKKFLSILLAAMLVLGMVGTAFADDTTGTYKLTITNDKAGHVYNAYQIFVGTYYDEILSNVQWGSGITDNGKNALYTLYSLTGDDQSAEAVAKKLEAFSDNSEQAIAFAKVVGENLGTIAATSGEHNGSAYVIEGLAAGYYLVKEGTGTVTGTDSRTTFILEVVGDATATPKTAVPQLTKKVIDKNDSVAEQEGVNPTGWQDSADHDIGDEISFKLTGTLASDYAEYTKYRYVFHDKQSDGLTLKAGSVKVYIGDELTGTLVESDKYQVNTSCSDECTFEVFIDDLKLIAPNAAGNSEVTVTYTATLNENAVIGSVGNPNTAYLEFANNPYFTGEGEPDTGTTPEDKVIVFTYKVEVNKVDGSNKPLAGAEFVIEKLDANGAVLKTFTPTATVGATDETNTASVFTVEGLDDGNYQIRETKTPDGYNALEKPIKFTIAATHSVEADEPTLLTFSGNALEGSAPGITVNYDVTSTTASTTVENKKGATLPSTGGIGTTIFYLLGSIMFIGAAMTLVVRRRAEADEV